MPLNLERNPSLVKRFSTAKVWLAEYTKPGAGETYTPTWEILPYISAPKVKTNTESNELRDGSNAVIYNDSSLLNYELSFEILQSDEKALNMAEVARDKQYLLLFKVGKVGKQIQYQFYGPGQINSESEIDYSDFVKISFTYKTVINDDDIPITVYPNNDTPINAPKDGEPEEPTLKAKFVGAAGVTIPAGLHRKILSLDYEEE